MKNTDRIIDIPSHDLFRLRVQEAGAAGVQMLLQRKKIGPFWTTVDSRYSEVYSELSATDRKVTLRTLEEDMVQDWFGAQIHALRA